MCSDHKNVEKIALQYEQGYKKATKKVCLFKICVDEGKNVLYNIL